MSVDATIESLNSAQLTSIRDAIVRWLRTHLGAAAAALTTAHVGVALYAGSAIIAVSIGGGAVDGAGLASSLATAYGDGSLTHIQTGTAWIGGRNYRVLGVSTKRGEVTYAPSSIPSTDPTADPTADPTTVSPTAAPTTPPPTAVPSHEPTPVPTSEPTPTPTRRGDTWGPTRAPTPSPTRTPTTPSPTASPTTPAPTTPAPTQLPTVSPTSVPTCVP